MNATHRINLPRRADEDDDAILAELAYRAIGAILAGFLAITLASVGALLYVVLSTRASAGPELGAIEKRLEVFGGQCRSKEIGNYVWHNYHYPFELDLQGGCGMVAVSSISENLGRLRIGWRLAYVDMGSIHSNALFPMRDEEQISVWPDGSSCNPTTWFGCVGHGRGTQTARGVSLGVISERDFAPLTVGAELGLYAYEGRFRMAVDPVAPSQFQAQRYDWAGYQVTPFAGLSIRYDYVSAMVRAYGRIRAAEHGCGVCSGMANGTVLQYLVGVSVPF